MSRKRHFGTTRAMLWAVMRLVERWVEYGLAALLACVLAVGAACRSDAGARTSADGGPIAPTASASGPATLPEVEHARTVFESSNGFASRAEAVALADQLAIAGAKLPAEQRSSLALLAGDVRRRAYRTFHVQTDAREAVEQYRAASRSGDGEASCRATLGALMLEAETGGDPAKAYEGVYTQLKRTPGGPCAVLEQAVLDDLAAYRLDPVRLMEIDAKAAKESEPAVTKAPDGPVVVPGPETGTGPATIMSLETFGARDAARVVIQLSSPAAYEVGYISEQGSDPRPRLFVDLMETKRGKVGRSKDVGGLVEKVRIGSHGNKTRVVLDLARTAQRRVFYLPEPFRVIIDVGLQPAPSAERQAAGHRKVQRVVLDPGHGGSDPGAIGPGGLKEKDVVLDIAHRAAPVLSRELGVVTMLTRDDDRFVPLEERTARANAFHADLFVSIHCNASEAPDGHGVQSYVLDLTRDEIAMRVAARENATSAAAGTQLGAVLANLRVEELSANSKRFAGLLQQATMASLRGRFADASDGGIRSAAFFVLLGAQMPATLFEVSFISNPTEESRLATADYRQKLADGIANAVRAYGEGR